MYSYLHRNVYLSIFDESPHCMHDESAPSKKRLLFYFPALGHRSLRENNWETLLPCTLPRASSWCERRAQRLTRGCKGCILICTAMCIYPYLMSQRIACTTKVHHPRSADFFISPHWVIGQRGKIIAYRFHARDATPRERAEGAMLLRVLAQVEVRPKGRPLEELKADSGLGATTRN